MSASSIIIISFAVLFVIVIAWDLLGGDIDKNK